VPYRCAYVNGFVVLAEGLDVFRLRAIATGGRGSHQAICPLKKELWLDGCLRVEPRKLGSLWLKASVTSGRIILVEGLHDWGVVGPCPF
jgi:hypothetical protein